jgi:hypothetical protein
MYLAREAPHSRAETEKVDSIRRKSENPVQTVWFSVSSLLDIPLVHKVYIRARTKTSIMRYDRKQLKGGRLREIRPSKNNKSGFRSSRLDKREHRDAQYHKGDPEPYRRRRKSHHIDRLSK